MNKKEIVDQEVQKTLGCFEQLNRLSGSPYFYTRLQARLSARQKEEGSKQKLFGSRWWRPAFIGLMIVLNLTTAALVYLSNGKNKELNQDTVTMLTSEYEINQDFGDLFTTNK